MENLEERVRREARSLRKRRALEPEKFDVIRMRRWLEEQRDYIEDMLRELQVDRRVLGSELRRDSGVVENL